MKEFVSLPFAARHFLKLGNSSFIEVPISYFSPIGLYKLFLDAGFQQNHIVNTFPIDMLLLCGLNYRADPKIGREAHLMRCQFESNFINAHGLQGLIELYQVICACGIGREIIGVFAKP